MPMNIRCLKAYCHQRNIRDVASARSSHQADPSGKRGLCQTSNLKFHIPDLKGATATRMLFVVCPGNGLVCVT